ncbi:hypothetical protein ISN45_Aa05g015970 [Arabidopsis thaliana x Arabidopsis arenosa]|uniref:Uncharacterized protein n=1 Tax=Arabidopsis thaliana x Arabidopsis arenosa TaxID=1240361 RepID=A0A8T1ZLM6_9BRAS|nr:hypothetical protein ISN45_Aa05g015970 [Arabidopsis thaliana x Arabidopsis arenosa]
MFVYLCGFGHMKGFTLEDATGLTVNGDIDIDYVFAGSLSSNWQASSIPDEEVELFIDASMPEEKEEPEQNGQRKSIHLLPMFLVLYGPVVQNGRREHGVWVEQFNNSAKSVDYVHRINFCQFGCIERIT